jgi:tetratricopeptide (TPR) repeat protein
MRVWLSVLGSLASLRAGCAGAPVAPPPQTLLRDAAFAAPSEPVRAEDVFALSPEMRRYLAADLADSLRSRGLQRGLVDALYKPGQLKIDYDTTRTRNASQAFAARSGNCLSLVIMTGALARELGLQVTYQSAYTDETWSRNGDLYLRSGHVNIVLGKRLADLERASDRDAGQLMIDFLPADELRGLRTTPISEATVIAMYMNNRAAEALTQGRLDDAYAWSREAVRQAPAFLGAWNTLGVIYLRHGERQAADEVFDAILQREPANVEALANRAQSLEQLGRVAEAMELRRRLAAVEPYPPFHFFDLGVAAMQRGEFGRARELFRRETERAAFQPEFQYWLGLASFRLGDLAAAREHLGLAMENSATRHQHDLYAAKLAWLRAYRRE